MPAKYSSTLTTVPPPYDEASTEAQAVEGGVLARITDRGRDVVPKATAALTDAEFGLGDLPEAERDALFETLKRVRLGAGDVAGDVAGEGAAGAVDNR